MIVAVDASDIALVKEFQAALSKAESEFCGDFAVCLAEWHGGEKVNGNAGRVDVIISRSFSKLVTGIKEWQRQSMRPLVAVSNGVSGGVILDVLRAGAFDYLDAGLHVSSQLQVIMQKLSALHRQAPSKLPHELTGAQTRVANLLLTDASEREISEQLGVSYFTIHNHVKEIYRKCNVHSRVQFVNSLRSSVSRNIPRSPESTVSLTQDSR